MALGASIDTTATPAQLHLLSLSLSFAHYLAYLDIQNSARVLAPSLKKATRSSHHSAIHLTRTKTPGIPLGNAILILALCSIRSDPSSQNVCSEPCLKQKLLRLVIILLVCDTFTRIAFWGEVVCYFRANMWLISLVYSIPWNLLTLAVLLNHLYFSFVRIHI